jgi:type IV secretion system protein VirB8
MVAIAQRPAAAGSASPFPDNRSWEVDRVVLAQASERRAWFVAWGALALSAICAGGGTLGIYTAFEHRTEVVPVIVDRATGETSIGQTLAADSVPATDATDKHHIAQFLRARESYSWWFLQDDYNTVLAMAGNEVAAEYQKLFEGQNALDKQYRDRLEVRIRIVSVRLDALRQASGSQAVATYERQVRHLDQQAADPPTRYVATLVYGYEPKLVLTEQQRLFNPVGFVVKAYRTDPEIATVATPTE